jgi:uncharacterized OB-fold protein
MLTRPAPLRTPEDGVFWDHLRGRELRLQRCDGCGRLRYPPAPCCPDCLSADATWTPVSGRGTLLSWVTMRRQYFSTLPVPYVVVAVVLEEGPIMFGNLDLDAPLQAGTPVELVLEECVTEAGEPLTLPQWRAAS